MRNPLIKRLPRELKGELGKYLVIFLFIVGTISIVSGWNVAGSSMATAYDESFEEYSIEDGNFQLAAKADDDLLSALETDTRKIYENFYVEEETKEVDSTLRIFQKREKIDLECLMDGEFPAAENEIAIDRMYADNNDLAVGDTLTLGGKEYEICGLVALSDYSALFSNPSDMMFDAMKFGVAVVTPDCFEDLGETHLHYNYSWRYQDRPEDDAEAKELSEEFLKTLGEETAMHGNAVTGYIPEYTNQAIIFTGDDIKGDKTFINIFLYIVVVIIAFVFAITTGNTIAKEANVIGTLRATGYKKSELVLHYMTMPMLVVLAAAIVGNILGYTALKNFAANAYYGSYSLPTYKTLWNANAFLKTTVIPLLIMLVINFVMLNRKLSLSPLKFIRRDLSRRTKKKAFRLNSKIGIMHRFQLRVIFQNIPNYVTIFVGVFFANAILMFGLLFAPMLDHYQDMITTDLLASHQYLLKSPVETAEDGAEKYAATALKTEDKKIKTEDATVYGISDDSAYVKIQFSKDSDGVFISNAYANKYGLHKGDTIQMKEQFGAKEYEFQVDGIYDYPAAVCVFMERKQFCETFDKDADYFNGYFSDSEITDIDDNYISTEVTVDDLTKTSRQLKLSMGNMMSIFLAFGILMFLLIVYLLSKIIIEKNAQSISMAKILGYQNREINRIYIMPTAIVVIFSMLVTIPIVNVSMKYIFQYFFREYAGYLPYYVGAPTYVKMAIIGVLSYLCIAFLQTRKVKKIPMADALKNVE